MKTMKIFFAMLVTVGFGLVACTSTSNGGEEVAGTVTDTGNTIAGIVKRTDGGVAAYARVRMARVAGEKDDGRFETNYVETLTDSTGAFAFDSALADTFQLAVIDSEKLEILYLPQVDSNNINEIKTIHLEKAAVFNSVLYYEELTEQSVSVGSHFKVQLPGTPFFQSVFAGDSFSMMIPAGQWMFTFCPWDLETVDKLGRMGVSDTLIFRSWKMQDEVESGKEIFAGPFIWSASVSVDSLIKEDEKKAEDVSRISGVVKCQKDKQVNPCEGVEVRLITDLYGFGFVDGVSFDMPSLTETDSLGRWFLPVPAEVPYDSFRVEFRRLSKDSSVVGVGLSRYVMADEIENVKDTLNIDTVTLTKSSNFEGRVNLAINWQDSTQNSMMISVVVGLKGTSYFVRELTSKELYIKDVPPGVHEVILYSGEKLVVEDLQASETPLEDFVTVTNVEISEDETFGQQGMTFTPPKRSQNSK